MNLMASDFSTSLKSFASMFMNLPNENPRRFLRHFKTISSEWSEPEIGQGNARITFCAFP
ncbi:MAG: hypothetical protein EBR74_04890 [Flavobacteriia bacterium]|nr:hypothetical protein [Flavobacteriia bacterium]